MPNARRGVAPPATGGGNGRLAGVGNPEPPTPPTVSPDHVDPARRRYAVIGTGAIGGYYGAQLVAVGHEVHFVARSDLDVVRRNGLRVDSPNGDLAGSGPGRDEHAAAALDRLGLPPVPGAGCDHFATRQMPPAWRRHHSGQLPEIGSWCTAPDRIRATMSLA